MFKLTIGSPDQGMSGFEFAASLVGSLAWPIATVIIACIFRAQISGLLARIRELAHGDTKVTFNEDVKKIEAKMDAVEATTPRIAMGAGDAVGSSTADFHGTTIIRPPRSSASTQSLLDAVELVTDSPTEAVLNSWKFISVAVADLAKRHKIDTPKPYMGRTFDVAKQLKEAGILTSQMMTILAQLRKTRNAAAHGEPVDAEGALRYVQLVSRFLTLIEPL